MDDRADLILANARVVTLDRGSPLQLSGVAADAVAISGDKILAVGLYRDIRNLRLPHTRVIDCRGLALIPGLIDAHCHVLAAASALTSVDCRPAAVGTLAELKAAIADRARETPPGQWVRAFGFEPAALAESRYPTRWELDFAAPLNPVRLDYGSGHGTVLNSRGLRLAGIDNTTPDPPEGIVKREEVTGEPDGLLLELSGFLRARLGNTRPDGEFKQGIARLNRKLLRYGITSLHDAGPNNGISHWETFRTLTHSDQLTPRVMMMAGAACLEEFAASGFGWGEGTDRLRLGHAKIMLTLTTGTMLPALSDLRELVADTRRCGFPTAIHAVEQEAVSASVQAITAAGLEQIAGLPAFGNWGSKGGNSGEEFSPWPRDRIEHCAECPPELIKRLRNSGVTVVTQPGFIHWRGDGYLERVGAELLPHLYPIDALAGAGIPLAFGSDAPVIDPSPWPAISAAVTRCTASGQSLPRGDGESGGLSLLDALRIYTRGGAWAEGAESRKGVIGAGMLADLALVDLNDIDPARAKERQTGDTKVKLTVVGGQVVWNDGSLD